MTMEREDQHAMDQFLWMRESQGTLSPNWNYLDFTEHFELGTSTLLESRRCMWKLMPCISKACSMNRTFNQVLPSIAGYKAFLCLTSPSFMCLLSDSEALMYYPGDYWQKMKKLFPMMMDRWMILLSSLEYHRLLIGKKISRRL